MFTHRMLVVTVGALIAATGAAQSTTAAIRTDPGAKICQMVVSSERGAKPYKLCLNRSEWDARRIADAKNANRMVCHYQERPGTKFRSAKVCMTAAEWANERIRNRQAVEQIQMRSCVPGGGC